jgi:hypothetical protein
VAVLTYSEIEALALDDLVANVSTDAPITAGVANEAGRFINDAYAQIWELSGGRIRKAPSGNAWSGAQLNTGTLYGDLTDLGEILHVFATTQAPIAVTLCTTTNNSADISHASAGFLAAIVNGWHISGTGIPSNTYVDYKTSTGAITMTRQATATGSGNVTITFSPTESTRELEPASLARILQLRSSSGLGTYAAPALYAVRFAASPGSTDVMKAVLEYYPGTVGYYFPVHYKPQFVPMDSTITTPDVNDIESRDIAHLAAFNLVNHAGRPDLAEGIAAKLSEGTRLGLERKERAMTAATSIR